MKPDYKNWVPKGMVSGFFAGAAVTGILLVAVAATSFLSGWVRLAAEVILGLLLAVLLCCALFLLHLHNAFSYDGKTQLAKRIIEKVADYVVLPENGVGLDVGCGSGALTIACAKKNKNASMVGLDRWGMEYASFSRSLCESNARAEGVAERTSFVQGNACRLNYPDEQFDAVTSNYCYHNIPSKDRQALILETLRVLKKGGTFAIHDIFTPARYGNLQELVQQLRDMGYEKAELLDTSDGLFMTGKEAAHLGMKGSGLLVGRK